jgi:hypothetical protein
MMHRKNLGYMLAMSMFLNAEMPTSREIEEIFHPRELSQEDVEEEKRKIREERARKAAKKRRRR